MNTEELQKIIRSGFKSLYSKILKRNQYEIVEILDRHQLPKVKQLDEWMSRKKKEFQSQGRFALSKEKGTCLHFTGRSL